MRFGARRRKSIRLRYCRIAVRPRQRGAPNWRTQRDGECSGRDGIPDTEGSTNSPSRSRPAGARRAARRRDSRRAAGGGAPASHGPRPGELNKHINDKAARERNIARFAKMLSIVFSWWHKSYTCSDTSSYTIGETGLRPLPPLYSPSSSFRRRDCRRADQRRSGYLRA